jgi:hypothetical protein
MSLFKKVIDKSLFDFAEGEAEKAYYEILSRAESPNADDYAKIEELLPYLGLTWANAKKDFEVLQAAAVFQQTVDAGLAADKELAILEPQYAVDAKAHKDAKEVFMAKYEQPLNMLSLRIAELKRIAQKRWDAEGEIDDLKRRFPRAFGQMKKQ